MILYAGSGTVCFKVCVACCVGFPKENIENENGWPTSRKICLINFIARDLEIWGALSFSFVFRYFVLGLGSRGGKST